MVEDQFRDNAQATFMGGAQESLEIVQRAAFGMHAGIVRDVVTVVAHRRRIEREQPDGGDAEIAQIIELARQAGKIPYPVTIAVIERAYAQLVKDRILVPQRIIGQPIVVAVLHACLVTSRMWAGSTAGSSRT